MGLAASRAALGWHGFEAAFGGRRSLDRIGLQLYTVRGEMARDFAGTLERVAAVGYNEVEFAGYFDRTPAEVKAILARLGLSAPSAHVAYPARRDEWKRALDSAAEIGHRYVTVPWIPQEERRTLDGWKKVADLFNRAGKDAAASGLRFAYHNHDFEFVPVDGAIPFDTLLAETDPSRVVYQLDLYWITKAGHNPMAYLAEHRGRIPMVHVKDSAGPPAHRMVDVGRGTINWSRLLARARDSGTRHFFVEHDQPENPMVSIRSSYDFLVGLTI